MLLHDIKEYNAFRYIPKNQLEVKLDHVLQKAFEMIEMQKSQAYIISTATRYERIMCRDILWLQKEGKNTIIYCVNGETFDRISLKEIMDELSIHTFCYK